MAHLLSESHTSATITHFLLVLAHDFRKCASGARPLKPPRVVSGMSWAMLHAFSLAFAGMNLPAYIDQAWMAALTGSVPEVSISLCTCHVAHHTVSRAAVHKLGKAKCEERRAVMWLFGRLERSETVQELDAVL